MMTIEELLAVLCFGLTCFSIGFALAHHDDKNHKRLYLQPQKCTGAHCVKTRDFETWVVESHTTWKTTETKAATCYQNGYEKKACDD